MRLLNSYLGYVILLIILLGVFMLKGMNTSHYRKMMIVLLSVFVAWMVIMQSLVLSDFYSTIPEDQSIDYLIVLGAGLKGDKVSYTLGYRLEAAADHLKNYEDTQVIVSGGQGPDELVSEAYAMKLYLMNLGIEESRIHMEDKSTSTEENIKFSKALIDEEDQIAIVTSNYHMYRAKYIAKPYFDQVAGISAHSPYWSLVNYMIREGVTIVNEWRKDLM